MTRRKGVYAVSFSERERQRVANQKSCLNFSTAAIQPGLYKGKRRNFCLHESCNVENIHQSIRSDALDYFQKAGISWHDGINGGPSNHLCCSQSACVNTLFPYWNRPDLLKRVLRAVGYPVDEVLPMVDDVTMSNGEHPYVSFEWIGAQNYLNETFVGTRQRGRYVTSADFAFRFRRVDGQIQLVLGEWKYIEHPGSEDKYQKNRSATYAPELAAADCPIEVPHHEHRQLFHEPFYQMMRLQLLGRAMERKGSEMDATIVSVMHVSPHANRDFHEAVTPGLQPYGSTVYYVWSALVRDLRFISYPLEELLQLVISNPPDSNWAAYMESRYVGMR